MDRGPFPDSTVRRGRDVPTVIALIPARAGSVRVPGKNVRRLAGHPLLAYAIATAREAGIFDQVVVSSESGTVLDVARDYGTEGLLRPEAYATSGSADIWWVTHALHDRPTDAFAILRPTSPFRRGRWVREAWEVFRGWPRADSLRAMRPVSEHPGKMWVVGAGEFASPLLPFSSPESVAWHSTPTQELPAILVQTAALEIAWRRVVPKSISGSVVLPWITAIDAPQSVDINTEHDWDRARSLAVEHPEWLPEVP